MMKDCKLSDWLSLMNKRFRLQLNICNGVVGSTLREALGCQEKFLIKAARRVGFESRYVANIKHS